MRVVWKAVQRGIAVPASTYATTPLSKAMDFDALALIAKDLQNYLEPLPGVCGLVQEVEALLEDRKP
jgi:hypothetical protein